MHPPRLFIFDPNLKSATGHFCGYDLRVAQAAAAVGIEPLIFSNLRAALGETPIPILAALQRDCWEELCPPPGRSPYGHLTESASALAETVAGIYRRQGASPVDVTFFPNASILTALGLARVGWLFGEHQPRTSLLFRMELAEQSRLAGLGPRGGIHLLAQALADLDADLSGAGLRLYTDSDLLTEEYGGATRLAFATAPIPVDPGFYAGASGRGDTATLLYLGDARTEKGYQDLPGIAQELDRELSEGRVRMVVQSNFNVAGGEPGIARARERLSRFPNVALLTDALEDSEYIGLMLEADLVLLPYRAEQYVARTSGILAEAICAGVPAVVPEGTWLSEQVRRHGAGATFQSEVPGAAAAETRRALGRLQQLRERARARRAAFRGFHNPDRLARFVCGQQALRRAAELSPDREPCEPVAGCVEEVPR
jgi:hypothetical protein